MKKRMIIIVAVLLCVLLFVVGAPVIINECYKIGGYITLWDVADILAYYGTILGAIVSIVVLAGTTNSTQKNDMCISALLIKW